MQLITYDHDLVIISHLQVCVHPGWLRTRMGTDRAPNSVEEGVSGILDNYVLGFDERLHNGGFFHAIEGERIPW